MVCIYKHASFMILPLSASSCLGKYLNWDAPSSVVSVDHQEYLSHIQTPPATTIVDVAAAAGNSLSFFINSAEMTMIAPAARLII